MTALEITLTRTSFDLTHVADVLGPLEGDVQTRHVLCAQVWSLTVLLSHIEVEVPTNKFAIPLSDVLCQPLSQLSSIHQVQ